VALQDHFHPPLSVHRHWHAFHNAWATYIAADLNHRLPEGYFAEPNVQFGIEIDVATFEESELEDEKNFQPAKTCHWQPPAPTQSIPFQPVSEAVGITIFNQEQGTTLAGAIELVSPANKDRAASRSAFISKCEVYLQQQIGLIVIDVVTTRTANLHHALLKTRLQSEAPSDALYTAAYLVLEQGGTPYLDVWYQTLAIGHPLPTMPLWLPGSICLPVDLAASYELTCREQRIKIQ